MPRRLVGIKGEGKEYWLSSFKQMLAELNLTVKDYADLMGLSINTVNGFIYGKNSMPTDIRSIVVFYHAFVKDGGAVFVERIKLMEYAIDAYRKRIFNLRYKLKTRPQGRVMTKFTNEQLAEIMEGKLDFMQYVKDELEYRRLNEDASLEEKIQNSFYAGKVKTEIIKKTALRLDPTKKRKRPKKDPDAPVNLGVGKVRNKKKVDKATWGLKISKKALQTADYELMPDGSRRRKKKPRGRSIKAINEKLNQHELKLNQENEPN